MRVMYPGSFDPITIGHIDLIKRTALKFDEVVVAIMINDEKQGTFSMDERLSMAKRAVKDLDNVTVVVGNGLTVEFAQKMKCCMLIRGIRAVMDYEYELQQATSNRMLAPEIETLFLVASPKYSYISSSIARELASYSADLSSFVPDFVAEKLHSKFGRDK